MQRQCIEMAAQHFSAGRRCGKRHPMIHSLQLTQHARAARLHAPKIQYQDASLGQGKTMLS
jgi:hypothetical protein